MLHLKFVAQCKGKGNKAPVQRYIPAVQHFIEAQKLVVKHDMKNIGLIKQDGKYYSIYDLPNGFVVRGDLDLYDMDLSDVNLNIKVTGDLNLYNATNIKLLPKTDFVYTTKYNEQRSKTVYVNWENDLIFSCPMPMCAICQTYTIPIHERTV